MQLTVDNVAREPKGAIDGPEKTIRCVACDRHLITTKILFPDAPVSWELIAYCPCGDQSETISINGKFVGEPGKNLVIKDVVARKKETLIKYIMMEKS